MDFSKLGSTKKPPAPTDPIKIFATLPSLPGTFNDLWRGQTRLWPIGIRIGTSETFSSP